MHEFGSSGVRGVAYGELSPADVLGIAQAAGSVLGADRAAVARDTRLSGPALAHAVASGLQSVGADVDRLGVLPTPGLQAYCEAEAVPGVMVTASHNPPEYNGIKVVGADGVELTRETTDRIEATVGAGPEPVAWRESGRARSVDGARRRYREGVLAGVDRDAVADAELTVAIDPGHGAGALTSPDVFRDLGCRVLTLNAQPDGRFPGRLPEPVADHLGELRRLVRTSDADVGVAHDGDADRAIFVDEEGELIEGGAALAALAAAEVDAGDVVVSAVNATGRLVDVVEDAGAVLALTPIGSTYLISEVRERLDAGDSVPVAGEGNGGIMFPGYRIARDGAYTAVRFCELVAGRSASAVVGEFDDYHNVRRDVPYGSEAERTAMLDAIAAAADGADADLDRTDGVRLDFEDGWVLARPSGTEPLVRVYAEASEAARAADLADWLEGIVRDA